MGFLSIAGSFAENQGMSTIRKVPNSKFQVPKKLQISNSKARHTVGAIGAW
jgi:hypothetical protein